MEKDKASTPNKGKDIHVGSDSDIEMANEARASNMEEDKASSPNKAKYIEMATNIVEKLDNEMRSMSFQENRSECCIYRVPKQLRNVNLKVYAPVLISIGPLHRRNEKLKAMEKEKRKYFKNLTEHNGMDKKKKCDIVIHIKNQEERLRHCYSEKFKTIESDDFVEMILLDAIFIIQTFLESNNKKCDKSLETRMTFDIREDLMLFENQIPLFIIQDIYDRVNPRSQAIPFLELATCYFGKYSFLKKVETSPGVKGRRHFTNLLRNLMLCKTILGVEIEISSDVEIETSLGVEKETSLGVEKETSPDVQIETSLGVEKETSLDVEKETSRDVEIETSLDVEKETSSGVEKETSLGVEGSRHFTDLLRHFMLEGSIERSYSSDPVKLKYTAVMLHKAGVRFQATRDKCLVNITFDKGVLKIPQLEVDHNFERLVRNIIAMEQCLYEREAYICSYIKFMDQLIDSAEDVGLLVENGIIVRRLGDDAAVSKMINNLCYNIDTHTCFGDISQKLNDHYKSPFNRAIANLVHGYFPNIWIGTGTVAAVILLILTLIQTIQPYFMYGRTQYN